MKSISNYPYLKLMETSQSCQVCGYTMMGEPKITVECKGMIARIHSDCWRIAKTKMESLGLKTITDYEYSKYETFRIPKTITTA